MKIGIKNTKLFSSYTNGSKNVLNRVLHSSDVTDSLLDGKFFPVDMYCMRTFYQNKGNTIQERFSECEECSIYKQYRELVRMELSSPLRVTKYEVMLSGRVDVNGYVYFDRFSNLIIINHLLSRKVSSLDVPENASVCGKVGYVLYAVYKKTKTMVKDIRYLVKELSSYNFTFVSFPKINGELITLTPESAITIDGHRILPYGYDVTGVKDPFVYQSEYFIIKVSNVTTVKSWMMSGKVKEDAIRTINTIALYINNVNNGKLLLNGRFWHSLFVEKVPTEKIYQIKTFDDMLNFLNGLKIKYVR